MVCMAALVWTASVGCSRIIDRPPPKEEVQRLLEEEAQVIKRDGERDVDPSLGVKLTWEVEDIEVREQAGNRDYPWAGTIRFEITSLMRELDKPSTETFTKEFDYVWDKAADRWVVR